MGKKIIMWIPNALTLFNLMCGFVAIIVLLETDYYMSVPIAIILIMVSVTADFFDGYAARKLKVESETGAFLDSFADIVSFGIAPAFLINSISINIVTWAVLLIGFATTIYVVCGAYRLARYNAGHLSDHFTGLPITAAGFIMIIHSLIWYLCMNGKTSSTAFIVTSVLLCIILAISMVSRLKVKRLVKTSIAESRKN